MARLIFLGMLVLVSAPLELWAQKPPFVAAVEFEGNEALRARVLAEAMETKAADHKFWRPQPRLNPSSLKRDKEILLKLYEAEGYYQARVDIEVTQTKDQAFVKVKIVEGEPVKVRRVDLEAPGLDQRWQRRFWRRIELAGLTTGEIFRLENYRQAKSSLIRVLAERGHPRAQLKAWTEVSAREHWAEVHFHLTPGPHLRLGQAHFVGLERTRLKVVKRELPWRAGEEFDARILEETRQKLMDLGVFSIVRVEPLFTEVKGDEVPIKISLVERNRHSISLGVGYGNEDQFRVRLTQSNRSVLGWGEVLSASVHYSGRAYGGLIDYRQPNFMDRQQTLNFRLGHEDREEASFSNERTFFMAGLKRPVWGPWWAKAGYTLEVDRPYNIETAATRDEAESNWVSAADLGLILDTRDSILDPRKGMLYHLRLDAAPNWLGSEVNYLLLESSAAQYYNPTPWLTLAGRIKGATIWAIPPSDDVPIFKRLFAGGSNSIRGYPYQKLGPLDQSGRPTGGQSLIEVSLEGRYPLWGPLRGVVFTEAGHLSPTAWTLDPGIFRYTVGLGLRYKTLIGPLRLDLGWQLNPPEEATFRRWQIHVNIGQAF